MYTLFSLLFLIFALSLQLVNFAAIKILNVNPNFVFIFIILWTLLFGFRRTFWLALLGGFIIDLHAHIFGFFMTFFILTAFFTDLFNHYIFIKKPIIVISVINIIFTGFYFLFNNWFFYHFLLSNKLILNLFLLLIYNFLLLIIFYPLFNFLKEKIYQYENKQRLPI